MRPNPIHWRRYILHGFKGPPLPESRQRWWRWLTYLLSFVLIAGAAAALFNILSRVDPARIFTALDATSAQAIFLASLCMAGSYLSLTFYDFFALRTLQRDDIPYRTAAIAGFSSYAIGHNLGATALTCWLVRYHVYSASGLSAMEVTKICFLTGLTFWLGNAFVLGMSLMLSPQAAVSLTQLPLPYNQLIGIALLSGCAAYIVWISLKRRALGKAGWSVALPGWRSTSVQIGIGAVDLICCILAVYALLPHEPQIAVTALAAIFVSALLLGYLSHSPGGLGVFDAAMLIGLPQFPTEPLFATLLLFRLIGYIVPGALAVLLLLLRLIVMRRLRPT